MVRFCYDTFSSQANQQVATRSIQTAIHELVHVLGFKDTDYAYYYNIETGLPRTPDPIMASVKCIDGSTSNLFLPGDTTLAAGVTDYGVQYFSVVTPTVRQVARNHFDCQTIEGARLENQPTGSSCFGDHWDEVRMIQIIFMDPSPSSFFVLK